MPSRSHTRRVLIVDAHQDTRDLYEIALRPAGYAVDHAGDGYTALTHALRTPPDVVITETHLPGIDGYLLCERLRSEPATRTIAIVVLTAEARPASLARARQAGADVVLTKPCLPHLLLTEVLALRPQLGSVAPGCGSDGHERGGAGPAPLSMVAPPTAAGRGGESVRRIVASDPSPLASSSTAYLRLLPSRTYPRSA